MRKAGLKRLHALYDLNHITFWKRQNDGDGEIAKALICLINNDKQGFIELSQNMGILPDALCEAVNDRLYDTLGDIAVEQCDDGYSIVVDYMEEIDQWLKTAKK